MKKIIGSLILIVMVASCRPDKKSLLNFDMSTFCRRYVVLVPPGSNSIYVFISKDDINRRFVVFKDFNYLKSGYGYMYATQLDINTSLKNGVFRTAKEAIKNAEGALNTQNYYDLFLHNITLIGDGQWSAYGEMLEEICPEKQQ